MEIRVSVTAQIMQCPPHCQPGVGCIQEKKKRKTLLSLQHKTATLSFAEEHELINVGNVFFGQINLFSTDGVQPEPGQGYHSECIVPTVWSMEVGV